MSELISGEKQPKSRGQAMVEYALILAMLAQRFHFGVRDEATITPRASLTLRPDKGVPVVIARR